jgi:hypothetical protein
VLNIDLSERAEIAIEDLWENNIPSTLALNNPERRVDVIAAHIQRQPFSCKLRIHEANILAHRLYSLDGEKFTRAEHLSIYRQRSSSMQKQGLYI